MAKKQSKSAVDESDGHIAAAAVHVKNPVPDDISSYIDNGSYLARDKFFGLKTDNARKEMINSFLRRLNVSWSANWQSSYEMVLLIREWENGIYWKELGYKSFEEFWKDKGAFSAEQMGMLEGMYGLAKIIDPKLFDLTAQEALARTKKTLDALAKLRTINKSKGG